MAFNCITCPTCNRRVKRNDSSAMCYMCRSSFHAKCLPLYTSEDMEYASLPVNNWTCPNCLRDCFPLHAIEEDEEVINFYLHNDLRNVSTNDDLLYDPYEIGEEGGVFEEIDPDENYLNVLASQTIYKCRYYQPDDLKTEIENKQLPVKFSFFHLNIRSTKKNFGDLQILLNNLDNKFTCIALTETWLKSHNVQLYDLEGYTHESITRASKPGGGISMYVDEKINYKVRTHLGFSNNDTEMIWLEIDNSHETNKKNLILGTIYRRPGSDIEIFNSKLSEILDVISSENKNITFTGDFNIDIIKSGTHGLTNQFMEINFSHSMNPLISRPTRVTSTSASLIDNFFTNSVCDNNIISIITTDISDHYPICFFTFDTRVETTTADIFRRDFSRKNVESFNIKLREQNWNRVVTENNTQTAYNLFQEIFNKVFKSSFPYKKVVKCYKNNLPWLSQGLKNSISIKHKKYNISRKHPTPANIKNYKKYKNKLGHLLRTSERNYFHD